MGVAIKSGFAIVFLMILTLGLPLSPSAEDIPDSPYDESDAVPYEGTPLFSIVAPAVAARATQRVLSFLHPMPGTTSPSAALFRGADANRPADARISLALLCTLLC